MVTIRNFCYFQISLRGWPLLPEHLPKLMSTQLRVRDVMTKAPRVLQEIERVGDVIDLMQSTSHNGFPVVYSPAALRTYPRIGSLAGLVMRKHLAVLLVRKAFHAGELHRWIAPPGFVRHIGPPRSRHADDAVSS